MKNPETLVASFATSKNLQVANWPQGACVYSWYVFADGSQGMFTEIEADGTFDGTEVKVCDAPTASELWEATRKLSPDEDVHVETAFGETEATAKATTCSFEDCEWIEGENLQEALANLWIHLQQKK